MSSAAAEKLEPQGYTLGGLVREALALNNGLVDQATVYLTERLLRDKGLLSSVIRDAVRLAVSSRVEHAICDDRVQIFKAAREVSGNRYDTPPQKPTRGAVVALANGLGRALLDFPLSGGIALRDATREQVMAQANRYGSLATDASHKEKWLRAIGQSVPDGKLVGDVITDDRAAELFREATA